ncbi:MAG TPA: hypothetical protein VJ976_01145 [Ornithinimicrobium sp.]|uniref:hypothetical protein n=1 Tax=Ornithinimicrobium sp. TaxID=1977084 RepID=UPI002B4A2204|nr:hypothetical protein [Ornithinimicrobium sp.]HKJ10973.1 hypothetical protein [Ornithinimicrobium sp.]
MSIEPDMPWWQKLLMALKVWRPPHRTKHHDVKNMPRPEPPPVTGAYGNEVVSKPQRRVPQRKDATP